MHRTTDESTRTRILDAAEHAFADAGFAGARVAAITGEAGVNKAMLYYYFGNKEALYQAVLDRVFDRVVAMAEAVDADVHGPPVDALLTFFDGYATILGERPRIVRILLRAMLDPSPDTQAYMFGRATAVVQALTHQVQRGQADGSLDPALSAPLVPPALIAPIVFGALTAPTLAAATGVPPEALRQLWLTNVRQLLTHGLLARPEVRP